MVKMGRPKGTNNKEYNYTLRMDEPTKKRLELYCEKKNISKSKALREAINKLTVNSDDENI